MTGIVRHTGLTTTLAATLLLVSLTGSRAYAGDLGKVLGALAAGYVTYEILDDLDDIKDNQCYAGPRYQPPRRAPAPAHPRFDPPPTYYHGGEAKYWYKEGYQDGFKDGTEYGYDKGFDQGHRVGYRQGEKTGYQRGVRKGYDIGYDDGYDDGHYDGYAEGVHSRGRRGR